MLHHPDHNYMYTRLTFTTSHCHTLGYSQHHITRCQISNRLSWDIKQVLCLITLLLKSFKSLYCTTHFECILKLLHTFTPCIKMHLFFIFVPFIFKKKKYSFNIHICCLYLQTCLEYCYCVLI